MLGALAFLFVVNGQRIQRLNYVSNSPYWSVDAPTENATSPTGYTEGRRHRIVPGHHAAGYFWIMRTQQAVTGSLTPHHIGYDNFPAGLTSLDTSPYRWWLTGVAWLDHALSGRPLPLAVEHSSLYADPLLQALLVVAAALFVGFRFGGFAAAATAWALVALIPFAGSFLPGAPDHHALGWVLVVAALLPLAAGLQGGRAPLWFALAGVAGGTGLWNDCLVAEPVWLGVALGAAFAAWQQRTVAGAAVLPWRTWGIAGGITCLTGWAVEYFPATSGPALASIHPLHAVFCVGLGEALHRFSALMRPEAKPGGARGWGLLGLALALAAALPVARALATHGHFLADDSAAHELSRLSHPLRATHPAVWLPLAVAGLGLLLAFSSRTPPVARRAVTVALGPVLVTLVFASLQPRGWNGFDAALVALLIAVLAATEAASEGWRWLGRSVAVLIALPGLFLLPPRASARGDAPLDDNEVLALVERDFAHWLAHQHGAEPPVVFTTPGFSEALTYYGNLRGVISYHAANEAGLAAATRLTSSSNPAESLALLENRRITHIIVPAWDPSLERFAQLGRHLPPDAGVPPDTLIAQLTSWNHPSWLRLMSYHTPQDLHAGNYGLQVFAVQSEQDEILSACRTADYFVEAGRFEQAVAFRDKLRLYPRSLPALAALAQVNQAIGDRAGYDEALQTLLPYVSRRAGKTLTIDRRISLAALLIQAKQTDATRDQMQQCLAALNADNLRELTTGEVVRLLAIADLLKMPVDPELRALALSLVPPTLRARLEKSAGR